MKKQRPKKDRNEVNLSPSAKKTLNKLASNEKRSLKNYMELVLEKHAAEAEKIVE